MKKTAFVASLLVFLLFVPTQAHAFSFQFPSFNFPFPTFSPRPSFTPKSSPEVKIKEIKIDGDYLPRRNLVELEFKNLENVKLATFILTYKHGGVEEAIFDNVSPIGGKKVFKQVFLGTCSTGSCVPHINATEIKLKVDGLYTNNQSFSKTINIY